MKSRQIRNSLLLVLTAFIWGTAFVAQSKGGQALGPFSFNCIRSLVGSVVLLPVIRLLDKINPNNKKPKTAAERKPESYGSVDCVAEWHCFLQARHSSLVCIMALRQERPVF